MTSDKIFFRLAYNFHHVLPVQMLSCPSYNTRRHLLCLLFVFKRFADTLEKGLRMSVPQLYAVPLQMQSD